MAAGGPGRAWPAARSVSIRSATAVMNFRAMSLQNWVIGGLVSRARVAARRTGPLRRQIATEPAVASRSASAAGEAGDSVQALAVAYNSATTFSASTYSTASRDSKWK